MTKRGSAYNCPFEMQATLGAALVISLVWGWWPATASGESSFAAYKEANLACFQEEWSRMSELHADEPAFQEFRRRLALIDEVTELVVGRLRATRSASLERLLNSVAAAPGSNCQDDVLVRVTASASEILAQYREQWAAALPVPPATDRQRAFLRKYYDAAARLAANYVAEQGQIVEVIDKEKAAEILRLYVVMPFLHVPDKTWSQHHVDQFPEWMKTPSNLAHLEGFCLQIRRPVTAYRLALHRSRQQQSVGAGDLDYVDYLSRAAVQMAKSDDYQGAIHCLRVAIQQAAKSRESRTVVACRLQLAELFKKTGHAQLAAEELKQILEGHPTSADWGKIAVRRLKYLYELQQSSTILKESPTYQSDARCKTYVPQIMYVVWATHRREGRPKAAARIRESFLDHFPKNPLAADLYFAAATDALAANDCEEALRLLEIVEYRYPRSKLVPRVRQIQGRLRKTFKRTAAKPTASGNQLP